MEDRNAGNASVRRKPLHHRLCFLGIGRVEVYDIGVKRFAQEWRPSERGQEWQSGVGGNWLDHSGSWRSDRAYERENLAAARQIFLVASIDFAGS